MRIFETCYDEISTKNSKLLVDSIGRSTAQDQARLLASRLKELKFRGVIFSSPYDCAMRTANTIAAELGVTFKPLACLRNTLRQIDDNFQGATREELINKYEFVEKDFELPLRWWGDKREPLDEIINRLKIGLEPVLSNLPKDVDVLLVGHGLTSIACRHLFGVTKNELGLHYNCHLSLLYSPSGECYANDCRHLPEEMRTTAAISYLGVKAKLEEEIETARRFYQENGGEKVMHIGDTHSWTYPYYKALIEGINPDVIVHTGDMVDEIKAGRIESVRPCWIASAKVMAEIMEQSGARVIIVPGNNDMEEILQALAPNSEILPRNTVVEFSGKKVLLCHEINRINNDLDAEVYLYGHGLTGETRTANDNERNGKRYYNVSWGTSLHSFSKGKSLVFYRMALNG